MSPISHDFMVFCYVLVKGRIEPWHEEFGIDGWETSYYKVLDVRYEDDAGEIVESILKHGLSEKTYQEQLRIREGVESRVYCLVEVQGVAESWEYNESNYTARRAIDSITTIFEKLKKKSSYIEILKASIVGYEDSQALDINKLNKKLGLPEHVNIIAEDQISNKKFTNKEITNEEICNLVKNRDIDALLALLRHVDDDIRVKALEAIGNIKRNRRGFDHIIDNFDFDNDDLKIKKLEILGFLRHGVFKIKKAAVLILLDLREPPDFFCHVLACTRHSEKIRLKAVEVLTAIYLNCRINAIDKIKPIRRDLLLKHKKMRTFYNILYELAYNIVLSRVFEMLFDFRTDEGYYFLKEYFKLEKYGFPETEKLIYIVTRYPYCHEICISEDLEEEINSIIDQNKLQIEAINGACAFFILAQKFFSQNDRYNKTNIIKILAFYKVKELTWWFLQNIYDEGLYLYIINALGQSKADKAVDPLLKMINPLEYRKRRPLDLRRDDNHFEMIQQQAIIALSRIGTKKAIEPLLKILDNYEKWGESVILAVAISLCEIDSDKAFEHLTRLIEKWLVIYEKCDESVPDPSPEIESAIRALGKIRSDNSIDFLIDFIEKYKADEDFVMSAITALGDIKSERIMKVLGKIKSDSDRIIDHLIKTMEKHRKKNISRFDNFQRFDNSDPIEWII